MFAGGGTTHVSATERSTTTTTGGTNSSGAYTNAAAEANDLDALVFEFGTAKCKFGYAGEDFPRVYESALPLFNDVTSSSTSSTSSTSNNDLHSEQVRADAAAQAAARFERDPEQLAQWLFDAAASRLHTRLSDHPLLFVERPFALPETISASDSSGGDNATAHDTATTAATPSSKKQQLRLREQLVEVLMEQLGSPALFCAKAPVLTCFANARTSGVVVDMGATYTSVTSVHDGYAFAPPKTQVRAFGGNDLDAFVRQQLALQVASLHTSSHVGVGSSSGGAPSTSRNNPLATTVAHEIARRTAWSYAVEAKESGLCRVADAAFDAAQNAQLPKIPYELPDKTVIAMGTERFSVPELYFVPSIATNATSRMAHPTVTMPPPGPAMVMPPAGGLSSSSVVTDYNASVQRGLSLPELICDIGGLTTETELRKELFQNIVLTGGSSSFDNLPTRLEREVVSALGSHQLPLASTSAAAAASLSNHNLRVKVVAAHATERKVGAFVGGSILASLGSFHEMWLSKAEYAEHGAALIHKKCP